MTLDGLAALDSDRAEKRQQRQRPVPPSARGRLTTTQKPDEPTSTSAGNVAAAPIPTTETPREQAPEVRRTTDTADDEFADQPLDDGPLRAAQVYLDGPTDDHLRRIRAAALVRGADVTNSAIVRRSVAEFVERHGYDEIVELLSGDPRLKRGRGRPRR